MPIDESVMAAAAAVRKRVFARLFMCSVLFEFLTGFAP
jgi:hypothetical protein